MTPLKTALLTLFVLFAAGFLTVLWPDPMIRMISEVLGGGLGLVVAVLWMQRWGIPGQAPKRDLADENDAAPLGWPAVRTAPSNE